MRGFCWWVGRWRWRLGLGLDRLIDGGLEGVGEEGWGLGLLMDVGFRKVGHLDWVVLGLV